MANDDINDSQSMTWYLDTGASNHMSGYNELFAETNTNYFGNLTFDDLS